jgi:virginiamycin A acetyltransferase
MTVLEKNDPAAGARGASPEGLFMANRVSADGHAGDDLRDGAALDLTQARHVEINRILYRLYGATSRNRFRRIILNVVLKLEKGELYSGTLRRIFRDYHNVSVGMYTHGGCFVAGAVDKYTSIGRYCSTASPMRVMNRNHPLEFKSTHGIFFNPVLGIAETDPVPHVPLEIGHDVWIGHNAIILPSVRSIGTGAVVGAGSVVNKEIPPYAVVFGSPARIIKYRFPKETIEELLASRWWEKSPEEIKSALGEYTKPYRGSVFIQGPARKSE